MSYLSKVVRSRVNQFGRTQIGVSLKPLLISSGNVTASDGYLTVHQKLLAEARRADSFNEERIISFAETLLQRGITESQYWTPVFQRINTLHRERSSLDEPLKKFVDKPPSQTLTLLEACSKSKLFKSYAMDSRVTELIVSTCKRYNWDNLDHFLRLIKVSAAFYNNTREKINRSSMLTAKGFLKPARNVNIRAKAQHNHAVSMLSHVHSEVRRRMPELMKLQNGKPFREAISKLSETDFSFKTLHKLIFTAKMINLPVTDCMSMNRISGESIKKMLTLPSSVNKGNLSVFLSKSLVKFGTVDQFLLNDFVEILSSPGVSKLLQHPDRITQILANLSSWDQSLGTERISKTSVFTDVIDGFTSNLESYTDDDLIFVALGVAQSKEYGESPFVWKSFKAAVGTKLEKRLLDIIESSSDVSLLRVLQASIFYNGNISNASLCKLMSSITERIRTAPDAAGKVTNGGDVVFCKASWIFEVSKVMHDFYRMGTNETTKKAVESFVKDVITADDKLNLRTPVHDDSNMKNSDTMRKILQNTVELSSDSTIKTDIQFINTIYDNSKKNIKLQEIIRKREELFTKVAAGTAELPWYLRKKSNSSDSTIEDNFKPNWDKKYISKKEHLGLNSVASALLNSCHDATCIHPHLALSIFTSNPNAGKCLVQMAANIHLSGTVGKEFVGLLRLASSALFASGGEDQHAVDVIRILTSALNSDKCKTLKPTPSIESLINIIEALSVVESAFPSAKEFEKVFSVHVSNAMSSITSHLPVNNPLTFSLLRKISFSDTCTSSRAAILSWLHSNAITFGKHHSPSLMTEILLTAIHLEDSPDASQLYELKDQFILTMACFKRMFVVPLAMGGLEPMDAFRARGYVNSGLPARVREWLFYKYDLQKIPRKALIDTNIAADLISKEIPIGCDKYVEFAHIIQPMMHSIQVATPTLWLQSNTPRTTLRGGKPVRNSLLLKAHRAMGGNGQSEFFKQKNQLYYDSEGFYFPDNVHRL